MMIGRRVEPRLLWRLASWAVLKGGAARAAALSPAKRKTIAKKAAQARWKQR